MEEPALSDEPGEIIPRTLAIHEAMAKVMVDVGAVGKGDTANAGSHSFSFRGIDAVLNAVGPALRTHGVIVIPHEVNRSLNDQAQTSKNKRTNHWQVTIRYRFMGPAGDHIDVTTTGESMDSGDKGLAKAYSVAYRIALIQALCLPTDEPDPDTFHHELADVQWGPVSDHHLDILDHLPADVANRVEVWIESIDPQAHATNVPETMIEKVEEVIEKALASVEQGDVSRETSDEASETAAEPPSYEPETAQDDPGGDE